MTDTYYTISSIGEGYLNEQRSKFYSFAHHISSADEALEIVAEYRKKYYDARHVCWAYRLGKNGEEYRLNDDGEPSSTAAKPIYGQMLSLELSDLIVIVVRYFGGIKLGTSGLIEAYRESARLALENAEREAVVEHSKLRITFDYPIMGDIMRIVKESSAAVVNQDFRERCKLDISIRMDDKESLSNRINAIYGAEIIDLDYLYKYE